MTCEDCETLSKTIKAYSKLMHSWKKDAAWYQNTLKSIRLAANDPNGTLEEIYELADSALKHEGRDDE